MRGVPQYALLNPEHGFWHVLGLLAKDGIIERFKVSEMPVEQYLFYVFEMEATAKYEKKEQDAAKDKMSSLAAKLRCARR